MNINFTKQFNRIDNAALSRFEATNGIRLPNDYRAFLLEHNGGVPVNDRFVSKYLPDQEFVVRRILPLAREEDVGYLNLESVIRTFRIEQQRIPKNTIPIVDDGFGNLFLIVVSGPDSGKIFFWSHEFEADPENDEVLADPPRNLELVADSFTEFLGSLQAE